MPSVKNSQTCLGLFLIPGICSASSFPIPCLESCCYGSSSTEHRSGSTEHTFGMHHMDEASERRSRTEKEEENTTGIGIEKKNTKKSSSQKKRATVLLGPVRV